MKFEQFEEIEAPTYGDLLCVETPEDEFSEIPYEILVRKLDKESLQALQFELPEKKDLANVIRWVMRGMESTLAILKIQMHLKMDTDLHKDIELWKEEAGDQDMEEIWNALKEREEESVTFH